MLFLIAVGILYVLIIIGYVYYWNKLSDWTIPANYIPTTNVSIIIAARNEENTIGHCLNSILQQSYPAHLYDIWVVNDHSEDNTAAVVLEMQKQYPHQVHLLQLADYINAQQTNSHKKKAIEFALQHTQNELIITTDADCIAQPNWLLNLVSFYKVQDLVFVAAPVQFTNLDSHLTRFQALDFMGMMLITGAGIALKTNLCNGANLAYSRQAFEQVGGFEGISHLASGDDMLLLHKIATIYPTQIGFLKNNEATIFTTSKTTWAAFWQQRIRWATKSKVYSQVRLQLVLAAVWLFCASIPIFIILGVFLDINYLVWALELASIKAIADFYLLYHASMFFNKKTLLWSFVPSFILHTFYIISVGLAANVVRTYTWKGRKTS